MTVSVSFKQIAAALVVSLGVALWILFARGMGAWGGEIEATAAMVSQPTPAHFKRLRDERERPKAETPDTFTGADGSDATFTLTLASATITSADGDSRLEIACATLGAPCFGDVEVVALDDHDPITLTCQDGRMQEARPR